MVRQVSVVLLARCSGVKGALNRTGTRFIEAQFEPAGSRPCQGQGYGSLGSLANGRRREDQVRIPLGFKFAWRGGVGSDPTRIQCSHWDLNPRRMRWWNLSSPLDHYGQRSSFLILQDAMLAMCPRGFSVRGLV